ncbi:FAD-dependent oxidoreductase [Desulfitibacter alkalitolerans]|uniref:FAD-dependent oxidoreductase n=1 Tax=Desulfitibacter alkalitolerans TaxID=264641 RepID=UPI000AFAB9F8|nr:FAD-dependent oxidoreductase [Desulfitibacter alkalitolerans]
MTQFKNDELLRQKMQKIVDECMGESPSFCVAACPLHVDVKGYIGKIAAGEFKESLEIIRKDLPFPGILGRICAHPCEEKCKQSEEGQPLSVQQLKRFAANYDSEFEWDISIEENEKPQKVAIIGAGPAGAMAAYILRKKGYQVAIFEKLPVVGGMMRVGIPAYRLPRDVIDFEYSILPLLGVSIYLNTEVGKDISFAQLLMDYDAVFIAVGAHRSLMLNVPGKELKGIEPGVDFLRNVSLNISQDLGKNVVVVGGGNVAIDVARSAVRKGAEDVTIICLEQRHEMPAHSWEIEEAEEEGVKIINGYGVKQFFGQERVEQLELVKCQSVFDVEGKFNPTYIENENLMFKTDMVILAIGQGVESSFLKDHWDILGSNGRVIVNPVTLQTKDPKVFAGGDMIGRPLIAIEALAHGKKAAISIDRYFRNQDMAIGREKEGSFETTLIREIKDEERGTIRSKTRKIPVERRVTSFDEVDLGFTEKCAVQEATRCLQCECKLCMKECIMLNEFCEYPKQLMEQTLAACCIDPLIPYSCNMCNQCTINCPKEYKFSEIFAQMRMDLVKDGEGPLPQHKPIHMHQKLGFHPIFNIVKPDVKAGFTKRAFMPGCSLPSYSPKLVGEILRYLQRELPGTGAVLRCCGKPTKALGLENDFAQRYSLLESAFKQLEVEEIIVACQSCYSMITTMSPHLKVRSLYEVLKEVGIPEEVKGIGKGKVMALHDSCVTRDCSTIHDSVRFLMREMGYKIEELPHNRENTRCCGFGGMVVPANPNLAKRIMNRRASEAKSEHIITYCAACRESMTMGGKKALHLMDLMFNRQWDKTGAPGLQGPLQNWLNRYKSKKEIQRSHM